MTDKTTTVDELLQLVTTFVHERDWDQFHDLKNISMNLSVEASELMEPFVWCSRDQAQSIFFKKQAEVQHELADVLFNILLFANKAGIDITTALKSKLEKTAKNYPVHLAKGRCVKYTELREGSGE